MIILNLALSLIFAFICLKHDSPSNDDRKQFFNGAYFWFSVPIFNFINFGKTFYEKVYCDNPSSSSLRFYNLQDF